MATTTSEVPVLIVGAGAVGCVLSMELARRGIEYRCIDRMPGPGRESRAIALHARTIELMDLVDPVLSRQLLERDLWCRGYVMHFLRDGERTEVRPGLDYTTVDSRYNCILSHNQSETEGFVREYTKSRFGRDIEYDTKFQSLTQDGDGVTAHVAHTDRGDEEELIRCKYLVAADGINSRVRRGLGLAVKGKDYTGSFFQNLDIYLNGFTDWTDHFHYCVGTDHFLMVAPLPGGHFRLLLSDRGEAADPTITPQQAFTRILSKHYDGITMGDVVWHSRWETWVRLADTFREGGVFLAGDSAHVHSTTGGQGMNCCMQDAFNLGWKLALVLQQHASPSLLDSYEAERLPVAQRLLDTTDRAFRIVVSDSWWAGVLRAKVMARVAAFALGQPRVQRFAFRTVSQTGINYRDSALSTTQGPLRADAPRAGDRFPWMKLRFANSGAVEDLFERLDDTRFTLLLFGLADAATHGALAGAELRVEVIPDDAHNAAALKHAGIERPSFYLLRPDGHVGLCGRTFDAAALERYFSDTLRWRR